MKHLFTCIILSALFSNALAQHHDTAFVDGKLYLRLKTADTTFGLNSAAMLPLRLLYHMDTCYRPFNGLGSDTLDRTYCLWFSDTAKTKLCIDTLRTLNMIDLVEQVPIYHTTYTPNDISPNQYALAKINAGNAWNITKGSTSVVVAIIDNGILATHQDLAANMVAGFDVANNDNNTSPPANFSGVAWNHGTHTSGIASAVTDNGTDIASIGFNTKIMPIKCTSDTNKNGNTIEFADEGITYAMQHGAKVISMSLGSYQSSVTEKLLITTAINQGIVVVAAAGNDDSSTALYPASYPGVICVGATDANDAKASFSNYGSRIDIMAPGLGIYSTFASSTNAYGTLSGTSMSTPMVAGLAALVIAKNPSFTPAQVLSAIKAGADNIDAENPGFAGKLGAGRINAFHALGGVGTGFETIADMTDVKFFPNPFANKLMADFGKITTGQLQLFDVQGRLVWQQTITAQPNTEIETSQFNAGIYILRLITADGIASGKLTKL